MAKKRSKSRKPATAASASNATEQELQLKTHEEDGASAQADLALHVNQKDLADASAEDIERASLDAGVAALSPRHHELNDEDDGENPDDSQAQAVASFAASAAESMLSWKLKHNGRVGSAQQQQLADEDSEHTAANEEEKARLRRLDFTLDHIPGVQHIGSEHENYRSDDDYATENGDMGELLVPNIKTYDLDSSSRGFLGKYIDEEMHNGRQHSLHNYNQQTCGSHHSLHNMMHSAASPCSSLAGGGGVSNQQIPHSKSLVMDMGDENHSATFVLQAMPSSRVEVVEVVAEQSWLITKLTVQLLWALRMSQRWILCALRLTWFVMLLFPPLFRMTLYYILDEHIHKNIIYGMKGRNLLDVYMVPGTKAKPKPDADSNDTGSEAGDAPRYPVVVFFTGGAWIIGYKAWGSLIGKVLSACGIVVVTPDYRNFPQGIVPDMVEDSMLAMQWVFENIHLFGGDPENVTIVGQSAGAHIAVCALLELVEKKENAMRRQSATMGRMGTGISSAPSPTMSTCSHFSHASSVASTDNLFAQIPSWELKQVRSFIGISGPYNIEVAVETFHRHGFDKNVVERIMDKKLAYYSPALRLLAKSELPHVARVLEDFPPVFLFHGTNDKTVSWRSSEQFASALESCRVPVQVRYFEGKTHTDPIIEDPILGDDFLLDEIKKIIMACALRDLNGATKYTLGALSPQQRYYPSLLVQAARKMNPF
ncbi:hypothetical protein Gpo141_00009727 [Globisporangium polare]